MALSNLGKNIFIGHSAAHCHMMSIKMGVYNLIPINGSVMIGNGQSISCTHKGRTGCHLQTQRWIHGKKTWDVKIDPPLIHDFSASQKP